MSNIIRQWNGRTIRQRQDGYLSATDMCQACNKLFADWKRLKITIEYLQALQESMGIPIDHLININESSGSNEERGTWVHRRISIRLAQWLSPTFAVKVDEWTEELMLNGKVELEPKRLQIQASLVDVTIANAKAVAQFMKQVGVESAIADSLVLDAVASQFPELKGMTETGKRLLSAQAPLESVGLTPTEIGERLEPSVNAKVVNSALEILGLQEKGTRQSTKTGKDKHFWQLTEKGKRYGHVYLATGGNNWSGGQIRWQESVIPVIQEYQEQQ